MSAATRVWMTDNALNQVHPYYHRWEPDQHPTTKTYCGLTVWADQRLYGIFIRSDHAQKIGHACFRCHQANERQRP